MPTKKRSCAHVAPAPPIFYLSLSIKSKSCSVSAICLRCGGFISNSIINAPHLKTPCERVRRSFARRSPPWKEPFRSIRSRGCSLELVTPMWLSEIERGAERNDASRINLRVRHVVMALDVIEVDRLGDPGLLI